jgi:hypothetical protein
MGNWPLTVGQYDVVLRGFSQPQGGQPAASHDHLLIGASRGSASKTCTARFSFTLDKHVQAQASFVCQTE